jgi:type I restriction enzyme M protein
MHYGFFSRDRKNGKFRNRSSEILFIDAHEMGELINRSTRVLTHENIVKISDAYHTWRNNDGKYEDVKGFRRSVPLEKVKELDYALTPGRYVGLADEEDDFDFKEIFLALKDEFEKQLVEEKILNEKIITNLISIKI